MRTEVTFSPAFAIATVTLDAGESVQAEAGAMVSMSSSVSIKTDTKGGIMKGLKRSVLGGESFFMNTFVADGAGGEVVFAPALPGRHRRVGPQRPDGLPAVGRVSRGEHRHRRRQQVGRREDVLRQRGAVHAEDHGRGHAARLQLRRDPGARARAPVRPTPSTPATWSGGATACSSRSRRSAAGSRRC